MYREESWDNGHYIDNHVKYECVSCNNEFIVGEEILKRIGAERPKCPYCGASERMVNKVAWTEDDRLEELASDMGCLAIYIHKDI